VLTFVKAPWPTIAGPDTTLASDDLTQLVFVSGDFGAPPIPLFDYLLPSQFAAVSGSSYFPGIPLVDDTPQIGERFYLNDSNFGSAVGTTCICPTTRFPVPVPPYVNDSLVQAVGVSISYPYNPNQAGSIPTQTIPNNIVVRFGQDQNAGAPNDSTAQIAFQFAPGVGFTGIQYYSYPNYLTSQDYLVYTGQAQNAPVSMRRTLLSLLKRRHSLK
jgi:hypothetical protein